MEQFSPTTKKILDEIANEAYKRGYIAGELAAMERVSRNIDELYSNHENTGFWDRIKVMIKWLCGNRRLP